MHGHGVSVPPIGQSPLAGSLTAGQGGAGAHGAVGWGAGGGRDTLAPFGSLGEVAAGIPRSTSPGNIGNFGLAGGKRSASPAPKDASDTTPRIMPIGRASSAALGAGGKNAVGGPDESHRRLSNGLEAPNPSLHSGFTPPITLNGLAGQAKDLGAVNTLYDRVVFVKNVSATASLAPLTEQLSGTMQWQDLKDLFRPAGAVIRADVATAPDGQSRGFGTVLFASKEDAQKAVGMFNG